MAAASTQVGYQGIIKKFRQLPAEVWKHSASYKLSVSTQYWPIPKGLASESVLEREKKRYQENSYSLIIFIITI